jgi:hypothetical protein
MNEERLPLKQRRDLGQIISDALKLYTRYFGLFLSIAALVVPLGIAAAAVQERTDDTATFVALSLPIGLLQLVANLLATATIIGALGEIDSGRPTDFSRAYEMAFSRLLTVAGAILRVIFHVALLVITIIGIPWAVQRAVRWLFAEQAVMLDGANAKEALDYSASAVLGSWWRTLGITVVIGLVSTVPALLITAPFTLASAFVSGTINAIVNALVLPFGIIAMTMLYRDLQVRKETNESADPA